MYISLTSRQNYFKQFNAYIFVHNHLKFQGELKNKSTIIRKSLAQKSNLSWWTYSLVILKMPKINFLLFVLYHLYNSTQSVTIFQPPFIPAKSTHKNVPQASFTYKTCLRHVYHRLSLLASCIMDLEQFPLDSQKCSLKFGSCKWYRQLY